MSMPARNKLLFWAVSLFLWKGFIHMKKQISMCLIFLLLLSSFCGLAASTENLIQNGNFESAALLWSQGELSVGEGCDGSQCLAFSFPVPNVENTYLHYSSFSQPLPLESAAVYSLSFWIRTDLANAIQTPPVSSLMPTGAKSINVQVKNVSSSWQQVSIVFMVSSSSAYELALMIDSPFANATFFIDNICLSIVDFVPVRMHIAGRQSVEIPAFGEAAYSYVPLAVDANGNICNIQNALLSLDSPLPSGVIFEEETGLLVVTTEAKAGESIVLRCMPPEGNTSLSPASIHISISGNILENGTFEDLPRYSGWDTELFPFSIETEGTGNAYATLSAHTNFENMYVASLASAHSYFLQADNMYVFRARLLTDGTNGNAQMQAQVLPPNDEGEIRIQIANIDADAWTDVFAAFHVPADGIYSIGFDFITSRETFVFLDDIQIQKEEPVPSIIYADIPAHIAIPEIGTSCFSIPYMTYTQIGSPMAAPVSFSVSPENCGVFFERNSLTIHETATPQEYKITVFLPDDPSVKSIYRVQITNESVGDGSFEREEPGAWWKTASPSALQYVSTYNGAYPAEGSRFARLTMNGPVSALMSNSVAQYAGATSYVFEANMKVTVPDIDTVVTVLVDNIESDSFDDNLVIGQFTLSHSMQRIQKLFAPSETVSGRLMIAFNTPETHDQQIVLLDMISVARATVSAEDVRINGTPFLEKNITGTYRFSSNFNAADSSSVRWLVSNASDGIFMPIESQNSNTLSITEDLVGKYVKFEVTPLSLRGPVVGDSVTSMPVLVGEPLPSTDDSFDTSTPPEILPPSPPLPPSPEGMEVLNLHTFPVLEKHRFFDLAEHWAKNEIEHLTAAGVLEGHGNGLFSPEALITRAEFSAILARAFKLAPIYYEGQFSDVKPFSWYSGAIAVVTKHGIAQGTGEKTFSPDLPITREEIASMLMRAYRKTGATIRTTEIAYSDLPSISTWAMQDIQEATALGLLRGLADGSFEPKRNATRAETAVTVHRMLSLLSSNAG